MVKISSIGVLAQKTAGGESCRWMKYNLLLINHDHVAIP